MTGRTLLILPAALILIFLLAVPYANIVIISLRPLSPDGAYGSGSGWASSRRRWPFC